MNNKNQILYAPNIYTGGGFVLLNSLLESFITSGNTIALILDVRAKKLIDKSIQKKLNMVFWIYPNIFSRISAELKLLILAKRNATVICFHNIPPILCRSKNITVFIQNRLILDNTFDQLLNLKTLLTIKLERILTFLLSNNIENYICQTKSMELLLLKKFTKLKKNDGLSVKPKVYTLPFMRDLQASPKTPPQKQWDFIFVSSGHPYKNHAKLLEAWELLASEGLFPSLAVTLSNSFSDQATNIQETAKEKCLKIYNLGEISNENICYYYSQASALIFPSQVESFGLPLIEANNCGLPILAPELDYVRDVCIPHQTFDPNSSISISRAIKRFLKQECTLEKILSPSDFWDKINQKI